MEGSSQLLLERERAQARERGRRFRERHPDRGAVAKHGGELVIRVSLRNAYETCELTIQKCLSVNVNTTKRAIGLTL